MKTYPFMQVDAFTKRPLIGNPCAVFFEADDLSAETMQAVACEMNLSESAFVMQSQIADFRARYFTPAEEIPLAGHPTIATTFALVESGCLPLTGDKTTFTLELQVGPIPIEILSENGRISQIIMTQKKPQFLNIVDSEIATSVFDLTPDDLIPNKPVQVVSTGTPQLMVPVKDLDVLRRMQLNAPAYMALREKAHFFSPHIFCLQGVTEAGDTFARHGGVAPDVIEDPFTGSATGGMAAYLWHYNLLDKPTFVAEQGHWMGRPGQAFVEIVGPRDDIETIKVGGTAVAVLKGELMLP
mgnify:CR=1 FL=1